MSGQTQTETALQALAEKLRTDAIAIFGEGQAERDIIEWFYAALLAAAPAPVVPDGYVLVPVEPTAEMMMHESSCQHHAADDMSCPVRRTRRNIWARMLAAAPAHPVERQEPEDLHVWRATTRFGETCHFGEASTARAWAGENGTVERVELTPVPELRLVERQEQGEVQRLLEALEAMCDAFMILLRTGHDRIIDLGGTCDSVSLMAEQSGDLRIARAAIAAARKEGV